MFPKGLPGLEVTRGRVNDGLGDNLQARFPNVRMWAWPGEVALKTEQKVSRKALRKKNAAMETGWQGSERQSRKTQRLTLDHNSG